jgi:hypothetical protein
MSQWKNIDAVVALSITAALAGTGCLAQNADDETTKIEIAAAAAASAASRSGAGSAAAAVGDRDVAHARRRDDHRKAATSERDFVARHADLFAEPARGAPREPLSRTPHPISLTAAEPHRGRAPSPHRDR